MIWWESNGKERRSEDLINRKSTSIINIKKKCSSQNDHNFQFPFFREWKHLCEQESIFALVKLTNEGDSIAVRENFDSKNWQRVVHQQQHPSWVLAWALAMAWHLWCLQEVSLGGHNNDHINIAQVSLSIPAHVFFLLLGHLIS